MRGIIVPALLLLAVAGCQTNPDKRTIAQLRDVSPDVDEVEIDDSLVKALTGYQRFLHETPEHTMAPEAMRRLADLQIEKEYGVIGVPKASGRVGRVAAEAQGLQAPPARFEAAETAAATSQVARAKAVGESEAEFEDRALMKAFGEADAGIFTSPTTVEEDVVAKYGVRVIGRTEDIKEHFYAISAERRIKHPAVSAITEAARTELFTSS